MYKRVDYDQSQHAGYARGRALLPVSRDNWIRAFREHAGDGPIDAIVDVGAGTGRFTPALADAFDAAVVGVEPSRKMREIAEAEAAHPSIIYRAGSAADIPMTAASGDLALMFLVWHHVPDRRAAANELARVLRPDARLMIATTFSDRLKDLLLYRYFPRTREIDADVFPTLEETVTLFGGAGFGRTALVEVHHRSADGLTEYLERQRHRALSVYEHLTDAEYEAGLAAMEADADAETSPRPFEAECDLLVLSRS